MKRQHSQKVAKRSESFVLSPSESAWSLKGCMNKATKSLELSMISRDADDRASELDLLHATYTHFRKVASDKTYFLLDKLQIYYKKMAARTCKYEKRMKAMMNAYESDDKEPIMVLRFLVQSKKACSSKGVSEGKALRLKNAFAKDEPVQA